MIKVKFSKLSGILIYFLMIVFFIVLSTNLHKTNEKKQELPLCISGENERYIPLNNI